MYMFRPWFVIVGAVVAWKALGSSPNTKYPIVELPEVVEIGNWNANN